MAGCQVFRQKIWFIKVREKMLHFRASPVKWVMLSPRQTLARFVLTLLITGGGSLHGLSQGFINLNFEDAVIVSDPSSPYYPYAVYASDAIPGWTVAGGFLGTNEVLYDDLSIGSTSLSILGVNGLPAPLAGNYSVLLQGGLTASSASIAQTAAVPGSAESLLFIASGSGGSLLVSLGGQNIPYVVLSSGPNYSMYGGNLPGGLAGLSEQLMFSAPQGGGNNSWEIDNIQFSVNPIPEPNTLALGAVGVMLLGLFRWRKCSP